MTPTKPRLEIIFRKGLPVAAFLHFREGESGRSGRTINIRTAMNSHYDDRGMPIGLELVLPTSATLQHINEALVELGSLPLEPKDYVALSQL